MIHHRCLTVLALLACVTSFVTSSSITGTADQHFHSPLSHDQNDEDGSNEQIATNVPQMITKPGNFTVRVGDSVALPCDIRDLGEYVVLWKKGVSSILFAGNLKVLRDHDRLSLQGQTLLINDVQTQDGGDYNCQVSSPGQPNITHQVVVFPKGHVFPHENEVISKSGGHDHANHKSHSTTGGADSRHNSILMILMTLLVPVLFRRDRS